MQSYWTARVREVIRLRGEASVMLPEDTRVIGHTKTTTQTTRGQV